MKRELVLDDEEKKTRFRKYLTKKALDCDPVCVSRGKQNKRGRRGGGRQKRLTSQCPDVEVKTELSIDESSLYQYTDSRGICDTEVNASSQHYENFMDDFIKKESASPEQEQYQSRDETLVQINPDDIREIFSPGVPPGGTSVIKHKLDPSRAVRLGNWDQPSPPEPVKRKSVIVRAGSLHRHPETEPEEPNINDVISSALSLFPDDIEMLRTLEAEQSKDPLVKIVNCWTHRWNEVNYDEQVISEYAEFCRYRNNFPLNFYNNNIIR